MIDLVWAVLSEGKVVDRDTMSPTLINVISEITASVPAKVPDEVNVSMPLVVSMMWQNPTESNFEGLAKLVYEAPNKEAVNIFEFPVKAGGESFHKIFVKIDTITFAGPGFYNFQVLLKENDEWRNCTKVPFKVTYVINPNTKLLREATEQDLSSL